MNVNTFETYYFWDKKKNKIGSFKVIRFDEDTFTFRYDGHVYTCKKNYADGKVFTQRIDVPEFFAEKQRQGQRVYGQGEYTRSFSSIDPDARIVFGD